MLKYLTKISMDIFPSVLATIIGAYIVNHYINTKPAADSPAAAVAPAQTGKDAKPVEGATSVASLPAPGIKAKGISEKSIMDRPAAEVSADRPADKPAENKSTDAKPSDVKPSDVKPVETAVPRVHQPVPRDKVIVKTTAAPVAAAPVVAAPALDAGAPATQDANDLARAAIERLRKTPEGAAQETVRAPEAPRIVTAAPPAVRPLPPPITVSTPGTDAAASSPLSPPYASSTRTDDPLRPTPPADIPVPVASPPLDLRADAGGSMSRERTNVADEMLSAAKSMFHAVLPKAVTPD
jgi:hypothetical protein